jgi:AcrR family transcriptional regulator
MTAAALPAVRRAAGHRAESALLLRAALEGLRAAATPMPRAAPSPAPPEAPAADAAPRAGDLRERCLEAAHAVIAERGLEALSLREVARHLGVSHQAPYKHFDSRDHLLAEVMRRCFERFAAHLEARARHDDPEADLGALGQQYLSFALEHPLEYRLMFGTPWPESATDRGLARDARLAFRVLQQVLARLHSAPSPQDEAVELDALYVWSVMHGLATILQSDVMDKLDLRKKVLARAAQHVMARIGDALAQPPERPTPCR